MPARVQARVEEFLAALRHRCRRASQSSPGKISCSERVSSLFALRVLDATKCDVLSTVSSIALACGGENFVNFLCTSVASSACWPRPFPVSTTRQVALS
eukprot:136535-Pyramimonas_sp.AAC.1